MGGGTGIICLGLWKIIVTTQDSVLLPPGARGDADILPADLLHLRLLRVRRGDTCRGALPPDPLEMEQVLTTMGCWGSQLFPYTPRLPTWKDSEQGPLLRDPGQHPKSSALPTASNPPHSPSLFGKPSPALSGTAPCDSDTGAQGPETSHFYALVSNSKLTTLVQVPLSGPR